MTQVGTVYDTDVRLRQARFSLILCRLGNDVYDTDSFQKQKTALLLTKLMPEEMKMFIGDF